MWSFFCVYCLIISLSLHVANGKDFTYLGTITRDFDEHRYYASAFPGIWGSVVQDCKEIFGENAHLVSIESEEESNDINKWLQDRGSGGAIFWTSGQYAMGKNTWIWAGNENANFSLFSNWDVDEPAQQIGISRVALNHINQFNAKWVSIPDTQLERFICEYESMSPGISSTTSGPGEEIPIPCDKTTDLVIVMDSSGSIGIENFELIKTFSSMLLLAFHEKPESRVGLIVYSESTEVILDLQSSDLPSEDINALIMGTKYQGGPTPTDLGILEAIQMFNSSWSAETKVLLVITDGVSNDPEKTESAAQIAHGLGIEAFALGISEYVSLDELLGIANGLSDRVFLAEWENLYDLLKKISTDICI